MLGLRSSAAVARSSSVTAANRPGLPPPQKRLRDVRRCAVLDCKRGAEHGDAVAPWVTRRLPFLTQRLR